MIKKKLPELSALSQIRDEVAECKRLIYSPYIQGKDELGKHDLSLARAAADRALHLIDIIEDDE